LVVEQKLSHHRQQWIRANAIATGRPCNRSCVRFGMMVGVA
jgi:hypothetical protein